MVVGETAFLLVGPIILAAVLVLGSVYIPWNFQQHICNQTSLEGKVVEPPWCRSEWTHDVSNTKNYLTKHLLLIIQNSGEPLRIYQAFWKLGIFQNIS